MEVEVEVEVGAEEEASGEQIATTSFLEVIFLPKRCLKKFRGRD